MLSEMELKFDFKLALTVIIWALKFHCGASKYVKVKTNNENWKVPQKEVLH